MTATCRRAACSKPVNKKNYYENVIFNRIAQSNLKICQSDPLKIAPLKCSTKLAMNGAFRRATCIILSINKTTTEI